MEADPTRSGRGGIANTPNDDAMTAKIAKQSLRRLGVRVLPQKKSEIKALTVMHNARSENIPPVPLL